MQVPRSIGIWFLFPLLLVGCRAPVVASYVSPEALSGTNQHGLQVGPLERRGVFEAAWLVAGDRARVFEQTDSGGLTEVVRSSERMGQGVEIRTRVESADTPIRLVRLEDAGGELRAVRVEAGGITNDFTPGALYLPSTLEAGERMSQTFRVRSDGRGIRGQSGTGTVTIEGLGSQRVATPAGLYDAFVFRWEMNLKVGAAKISLTQTAWVDRSEGLVAETVRDRVSVFGVPVQHEERVSVLKEGRP